MSGRCSEGSGRVFHVRLWLGADHRPVTGSWTHQPTAEAVYRVWLGLYDGPAVRLHLVLEDESGEQVLKSWPPVGGPGPGLRG